MAEQFDKMFQFLLEDRKKRDQEFAAERDRLESERKAREKETRDRMDVLYAHMEKLVKMVEESHRAPRGKSAPELSVKLVPFSEKDDIEAYLVTFERIMTAHMVDKERWPHFLVPQLSGRAQLAFAALPTTDSGDYEAIKAAILARYDINEEAYRRRFRTATRKGGESNRELAVRLMDLQGKWLRRHQTMEQVQEAIGIEQFLDTLETVKRLWVMEKKPETCIRAGELADEYELARRVDSGLNVMNPVVSDPVKCSFCGILGHEEGQCRKKATSSRYFQNQPTGGSSRSSVQCYNCKTFGHVARNCPEKQDNGPRDGNGSEKQSEAVMMAGGDGSDPPTQFCKGKVEGKEVNKILLDSGCCRTMVHQRWVLPEKFLYGRSVAIRCVHGDIVLYPLANVTMEVEGTHIQVEAAVSSDLPVAVLLGTDVPQLIQLFQGRHPISSSYFLEDVMMVTTRAMAKQQIEEEIRRKEKERASGATPSSVSDTSPTPRITKEDRRALNRELGTAKEQLQQPYGALDISTQELRECQKQDDTLAGIRRVAEANDDDEKEFFWREGLLYRRWCPSRQGEDAAVEQLVLPRRCRRAVLDLAHEIPVAGHLGKEKTRERILRRFYWPSLNKDVELYCRSCRVCQKSTQSRVKKAPMVPLPVIEEPFSRIAMDIVGPLPKSSSGNRYILVLCDYASRYPEAVPLRSIEAENIADELIKVFARVGIPREILTDQGSNFCSQLLAELYRLLHVQPIRTSPYHPQTDGVVERFNKTLKSMLRKLVEGEGKKWDMYLPYLLFAYREVPQSSTGFSPFELLYGREVRGPLDVLRETWVAGEKNKESVVSHVLEMRERLKEMAQIVRENVEKEQSRQKFWYDKGARSRVFSSGDLVLVLLPTSSNKLLAQWQGPYQVKERKGDVNYLVDMHDKKKRFRIFHINTLKEYQVRHEEGAVCFGEEGEVEKEIPAWDEAVPGRVKFGVQLNAEQRAELEALLQKYADAFSDTPGKTHLVEHYIETEQTRPVKVPPYRIPHAYRKLFEGELQEMLKHKIIEPSTSEWAAPILPIKKKDGTWRFCVDFRRLNSLSRLDAYPMPRVDELIDRLGQARFISTIDLTRGYWQIPIVTKDREKTAFTTPYGLFHFMVLPFGLNGAPACFQRLMDRILKGCEDFAAAYLDDVVIYSISWQEHLRQLEEVLSRIRRAGLTIKASKCQMGMEECLYLGHTVGSGVVRPEVDKLEAVRLFPVPKTKRQVRTFLGLTGYYRKFIPDYASISAALSDLTKKSAPNTLHWTEPCQKAFDTLRERLCSSPVLRCPDLAAQFVLQTDASERGVGAVLSQQGPDGQEHPVGYFSRKYSAREQNYSTVEKECLAIKLATQAFQVYLLGREFVVETDHRALEWLHRFKDTNPRLCRWSLMLQPFKFTVRHKAGVTHGNADALSRAGD